MKRWSVLFLALALWALAGCGGPAADEGAAGEAPSVFAEASAPDAEGGLSAVRLEGQARPLTDEEIQAAYFRAEEAYGWFSLETLPCGEKTQTIDGWLYYPVEYPGMENLADLRAYLRGCFRRLCQGGIWSVCCASAVRIIACCRHIHRVLSHRLFYHCPRILSRLYGIQLSRRLRGGRGIRPLRGISRNLCRLIFLWIP